MLDQLQQFQALTKSRYQVEKLAGMRGWSVLHAWKLSLWPIKQKQVAADLADKTTI